MRLALSISQTFAAIAPTRGLSYSPASPGMPRETACKPSTMTSGRGQRHDKATLLPFPGRFPCACIERCRGEKCQAGAKKLSAGWGREPTPILDGGP